MIRRLAATALLAMSPLLPHQASGFSVEAHLDHVGGRTYVEAVIHAPSPQYLDFTLANDTRAYHVCTNATACHFRYELANSFVYNGNHPCPETVQFFAADYGWHWPLRSRTFSATRQVC